ncbi:MAG TPA: CHAP domain-containing protein, partial [Conexibacter sp.]|nr:CHAP domain-containing protein [Conexibacter sp.]
MSLALAIARVEQLERALAPPVAAPQPTPGATAGVAAATPTASAAAMATAGSPGSFAGALQGANGLPYVAGGGGGAMPLIAGAELGQAEQPPGSNDSARIATYRTATAGSGVGPWCAYFVSWAARQAGTPLGDQGQGFGSVDALYAWAQGAGRAVPNGPGVVPRPGDLIVWDEHIGIVEQVLPDGRIQTIEGNSSDRVSRNVHAL